MGAKEEYCSMCYKRWKKWNWSLIFSIIAFLLSVLAAFQCDKRIEADWMSVLVGILSLLVALLVGWQIYNALDLNKKVKDLDGLYHNIRKEVFNEMHDFESKLDKKLKDSINEIKSKNQNNNLETNLKVSSYFTASLAASGIYNSPKLKMMFLNSSLKSSKQIKDKLFISVIIGIWKDILLNNKELIISKKEKEEWLYCLEDIDTKDAVELRNMINSLKEC